MKKILYVDMDNVLVDFRSAFPRIAEETLAEYHSDPDEIPGIFSLMDPMEGAIDGYLRLSELFDTYILSTAPWENPSAWSDKLLWVKEHLGEVAYKRLIISHNKNLHQGHFLIDDRPNNGADQFPGEHIMFGSNAFPDWPTVVDYLSQKELGSHG